MGYRPKAVVWAKSTPFNQTNVDFGPLLNLLSKMDGGVGLGGGNRGHRQQGRAMKGTDGMTSVAGNE